MRFLRPARTAAALSLATLLLLAPQTSYAQSSPAPAATPTAVAEPIWRHAISIEGPVKYPAGFAHFDFVNPNAPKAGTLRLTNFGTFDTLNPVLDKGEIAFGLRGPVADASGFTAGLVFERLMKDSLDELSVSYGLLAEAVSYPDDLTWAKFRLRPEAKWSDGQPVTPEDVVFSFDKAKELDPSKAMQYEHVTKAEKTGEREITFTFDAPGNRELPSIVGSLLIVPKHWWEGKDASGNPRDISKTTLEIPVGSGPYELVKAEPGAVLQYRLRDDYWGKDLNINVGFNNFREITSTYYADLDVAFEAFRAGNADYRWENGSKRWATGYDFPAVKDGRIKRVRLENEDRSSGFLVGFIMNMRRDIFKEPKLREALNYAFDFEEIQRTLFFGEYKRINSFFFPTELASSGLPQGKELEILTALKDKLPPEIFTKPYENPVGGTPKALRENLKKAIALLKEAGYELKKNKMVNVKTGKPLTFEVLLEGDTIEDIALTWTENLRKIGIDASIRTADESQYGNRRRTMDFDVLYDGWSQSLHPGNEQTGFWGSTSVDVEGSDNYAGLSDPAVDALVQQVIFAKDRETLAATTRALDRVLLSKHIVVPSYGATDERLAYVNTLAHPDTLPYYSIGFPAIWWSTAP